MCNAVVVTERFEHLELRFWCCFTSSRVEEPGVPAFQHLHAPSPVPARTNPNPAQHAERAAQGMSNSSPATAAKSHDYTVAIPGNPDAWVGRHNPRLSWPPVSYQGSCLRFIAVIRPCRPLACLQAAPHRAQHGALHVRHQQAAALFSVPPDSCLTHDDPCLHSSVKLRSTPDCKSGQNPGLRRPCLEPRTHT